MGQFSWLDCVTGEQIIDNKRKSVYVLVPKEFGGGHIKEGVYDGYGHFGGHDIYELVADWNKEYISFDNIYQLKNSIATSFLGHDGTEVGIYGGVMPYRTRPNYMIIKNCNVAGRTNDDNKLSVEIELLNAGE